jgi:hypothetical protein
MMYFAKKCENIVDFFVIFNHREKGKSAYGLRSVPVLDSLVPDPVF